MTSPNDSAQLGKIKKQVEFYFGDSNYPRDKFLQAEAAKSDQGWIDLVILTTFNRMNVMGATSDLIQEALKDSLMVEVSSDGTKLKRKLPLPDDLNTLNRSLYVKGFPTDTLLDHLEEFFATYPGVTAIRMRRFRDEKTFKGSIFVEFDTKENADIALPLLKGAKYCEQRNISLIAMSKADYLSSKLDSKKTKEIDDQVNLAQDYVRGCLMHVSNVPEGLEHLVVKKAFQALDFPVAYFERLSDGNAFIRLKEGQVSDFMSKYDYVDLESNVRLDSFRPATEEEENEYYHKLSSMMKGKNKNHGRGKKGAKQNLKKKNDRKRDATSEDEDEGSADDCKQVKLCEDQVEN